MAVNLPFPQLDVIAVGAHPDDVEIACGGTLAQLVRQGYQVGIIDLTDGEPTPGSTGREQRLAEAKKAAQTLGVQVRVTLELPNRRLFDSFDSRIALAKEFRKYRPKIVIGFGDKTPMASPDHWQAMQITDAAVFYSRLTKWEEHFDGLPVHPIQAQLYFRLAFEPQVLGGYPSQFTVDITETLEMKLASIRCYQSQFPPAKAHVFDRIRGMALLAGAASGFYAGESFVATRPLGSQDLVKTVLPRTQAGVNAGKPGRLQATSSFASPEATENRPMPGDNTMSDENASRFSPPPLPPASHRPFYFSLLQLLACMLLAALLATVLHYLLRWMRAFPEVPWLSLPVLVLLFVGASGPIYLLLRTPFLVFYLGRFQARWKALRAHRRELRQWAEEVRDRHKSAAEPGSRPPKGV